jgi:hypothetical protein
MRKILFALVMAMAAGLPGSAKVVVFWQPGFPTVASQPVSRETLAKALDGMAPVFADLDQLKDPATLEGAELLALPYGSAFPTEGWSAIQAYLRAGGNLVVLGGQALRVPVTSANGRFAQAAPQDTYSRDMGIQHTYEAPVPTPDSVKFAWRTEYGFLRALTIHARRFFVLEGRLSGLGFAMNDEGLQVAAPVVVMDRAGFGGGRGAGAPAAGAAPAAAAGAAGPAGGGRGGAGGGAASRVVLLDFDPAPGFWDSADGISLIAASAGYARQGVTTFSLEMPFSTLKPGEPLKPVVHLRNANRERANKPLTGEVRLQLLSGNLVEETQTVPVAGAANAEAVFTRSLPPGFYTVRGVWMEDGQAREAYQNGVWVEDAAQLKAGPALGVNKDFLTSDGKPFFPVGANYFSTEANGWDFSGPRNAWIWDRDFEEMQRYGVTFVRTGVWGPTLRLIDAATKGVTERFLRNLEAYLLSAHRHGIAVNFTFYAFTPRPLDPSAPQPEQGRGGANAETPAAAGGGRGGRGAAPAAPPEPNVYVDPQAVRTELNYVLSIVNRFKDVPWLCYDLINEPSFSNPNRLWTGNTPNGDAAELDQWHKWLAEKYTLADLGAAWRVTPDSLGGFDNIPLPSIANLTFARYQNAGEVRAFDYNLFAQDKFTGWVRAMVDAIRATGSKQLINVGQDEGGVTNRVLNQFYSAGGVSFTTNHTYWQDDALLWDSVAAKRPGIPNITGETGYQPVRSADSTWRYDELTGNALNEKKWVLGFAAGSSGAMMWDWDREVDFGIKRSDGSAKTLQAEMRGIGQFAAKAEAYATDLAEPQVALVLPQSYQLSIYNKDALSAEQNAVRALYQYARGEAYAVGEYQIQDLGSPKLIILPAPRGLAPAAWDAIRAKVSAGATLLVSGPFDGDAHFHATGREKPVGLAYETAPLEIREELMKFPGGDERLSYGGDKTTYLDRAVLPDKSLWAEKMVGRGKILFSPLPLELNDNLQAIGDVYRYAMKTAGVTPSYSTTLDDPGILICPTKYPHATLYALTSESEQTAVNFTDQKSGKQFTGTLEPGRSALLLIGQDGALIASYNWR